MARTVIGWENFELLCNSTGGILMKYIGNIFTATKADVSQERDSFRGGQGHRAWLPGEPAQPILCLTVPQPLPFPGCRLQPGLGLFCCSAGTGGSVGRDWGCLQPELPAEGSPAVGAQEAISADPAKIKIFWEFLWQLIVF